MAGSGGDGGGIAEVIKAGDGERAEQLVQEAASTSREALQSALSEAAAALAQMHSTQERKRIGSCVLRSQNTARAQNCYSSYVREQVSDALAQDGEYTAAGSMLAASDLDATDLDSTWRFKACVRAAMLFLEEDEHVQAESMISKAASFSDSCSDSGAHLQFRMSYARVLDAKRRFLEAALQYYSVSQVGRTLVEQGLVETSEVYTALDHAIICALLAHVGPQKARNLDMLYKDQRCTHCPSFHLLQKVHSDRMLRPEDADSFKAMLKPHQLAVGSDGITVADRAITEHNILSASKLYRNIRSQQLGRVLNVSAQHAEKAVARLIADGRLVGSIDQMQRLVRFDIPSSSSSSQPMYKATAAHFDEQVRQVCLKANDAVSTMHKLGL